MFYSDPMKLTKLCWLGLAEDYTFSDRIGISTMTKHWLSLRGEYGISVPLVISLVLIVLMLRHAISLFLISFNKKTSMQRDPKTKVLRRRMTPIGKFALASQTETNQSIITFFIALSNKVGNKPMDLADFESLWDTRIKSEKRHERFGCCVSEDVDGCFEKVDKPTCAYASEYPHPQNIQETKVRIEDFLTRPIDVYDKLWQMELSSGSLGTSGTILHSDELKKKGRETETLALFRSHHCLCDGVSLSAVIADLSNESKELRNNMLCKVEANKQRLFRTSFFARVLSLMIGSVSYYVLGTMVALSFQVWNMISSSNPFDMHMKKDSGGTRSVAWTYLGSIEDAKQVTKSAKKDAKLNDLFVSCLTSAIERQYEISRGNTSSDGFKSKRRPPTSVNVTVTTHLRGGIILPSESIGNNVGAFVVTTPFKGKAGSSVNRLRAISKTLKIMKRTPAPQLSYLVSSFISNYLPERFAQSALAEANCHSVATISNVHGFTDKIHWDRNPVEMICAFLPCPETIPIGVVVTSYNHRIIMSVNADADVVPDADAFLNWMVEEYETIKRETTHEES